MPTTAVVDRSVLESSPRQLLRDLVRIAQLLLVPVRASHIPRNAFDPDRTARRFFELFTRPVFRMYVLTGNTASSLQWCPCCREGKHTEFGDFYGSVSRVGRKVCKGTPVCGHALLNPKSCSQQLCASVLAQGIGTGTRATARSQFRSPREENLRVMGRATACDLHGRQPRASRSATHWRPTSASCFRCRRQAPFSCHRLEAQATRI